LRDRKIGRPVVDQVDRLLVEAGRGNTHGY
jgi:hypothetical protein